jgi:methionyl-tRNA formyltransferase
MKSIIVFGNTIFTKEILETLWLSKKYKVAGWTGNASGTAELKRAENGLPSGNMQSINAPKDDELSFNFRKIPNEKVIATDNIKNYYGNPVENFCMKNDIPVYVYDSYAYKSEADRLPLLKKINPDLCIVIAYGKIISQDFLDIPKYGFINIHGSLLPDLRGATPIQTALLKGYKQTGATIQKMVYKMDAGDILKTYEVDIDDQDNFETLRGKMIEKTKENIVDFVEQYFEGKIEARPQDESKATICKIKDFSREKGKVDWNNTAENIHNKIRAFYPEPVAWGLYEVQITRIFKGSNYTNGLQLETKPQPSTVSKLINFHSSNLTDQKSEMKPGTMFYKGKKLYVSTNDNDLEITKLVLEGKKPMTGVEFGNGWVQKKEVALS